MRKMPFGFICCSAAKVTDFVVHITLSLVFRLGFALGNQIEMNQRLRVTRFQIGVWVRVRARVRVRVRVGRGGFHV